MHERKIYLRLLVFSCFLLLLTFLLNKVTSYTIKDFAKVATKNISRKQKLSAQSLKILLSQTREINHADFERLFNEENIGLYYFSKDSLLYWNNAQIPFVYDKNLFVNDCGLVKLKQGLYLYFKSKKNAEFALALCLIKPNYELQNNYLKNNFSDWVGISKEVKISKTGSTENAVLLNDNVLFFLEGSEQVYQEKSICNSCYILFLFSFLLLIISLLLFVKENTQLKYVFLFVPLFLLLRGLMIYFKWPNFFYKSVFYDVQLFGDATSYFNFYLGDVFLNAMVILFTCVLISFKIYNTTNKLVNYLSVFLLCFLIGFNVIQFNTILISLVSNSTLNFDFLCIFNIKPPIIVAFLAISCYYLSLFVLVNKLTEFFAGKFIWNLTGYFFLLIGICLVIKSCFNYNQQFENYWLLVFSLPVFLFSRINTAKNALIIGFQILILSIITSVFLNFYINQNQKLDLKLLSFSLSERKDAILESEFNSVSDKLFNDEKLKVLLDFLPNSEKEIVQLLKQKYFGGYFNRYTIEFSMFDKNCKPLFSVKDPILLNEGFFEDQIKLFETDSISNNLFFVGSYKKSSRYIAKLPMSETNLYLRLEPKQFEELGSFPDLLLDQSQQKPDKLKKFSHAVYRSGQLSSRYGDFNYPYFMADSVAISKSDVGYTHYFFRPDDQTEIIISQNSKNSDYYFTYNSYLFLFFSVICYSIYFIYSLFFIKNFTTASFTRRIQFIIIILILLAISAVGYTSTKLVSNQFEADNIEQLKEKTQTIISEFTAQFISVDIFEPSQQELVNLKIKEYAHLFKTDISLFSKTGSLFTTSEPRLYELGLATTRINPKAFKDLMDNKTSSTTINEKAGDLNYLSFYTPLFDNKKEIIGFINLPYYAKQTDLTNELSDIISAFINVYVILFVISVLSGLILAGYITRPLQLIKKQIANITLGKQNEKIKWESNDEIGKLVGEYNQMLIKLEYSANLLAQNERESAWREMAKQVAHEIKNPLTPMKLNLQYLQHLIKNNSDDFKEKFENASNGIIEQIDSLANIANEFSNFAKFPKTNLQLINLAEIINISVSIFQNQKNVLIINDLKPGQIFVMGDKDQALRVFNNIIKNAVQALDDISNPKIEIGMIESDIAIIISIKDNGTGINPELQKKLFTPNFTTKNTGSGLGLAMVKNIMQGFYGKVWFESEINKGTCFYLEFLKKS